MTPTRDTWTGYDTFWTAAGTTTADTERPDPADAYAAFAAAAGD